MIRQIALLGLLGGCVTGNDCDARVAAAVAAAKADAPDCTFAPEALEELTCGGTDQSPELAYYATWCGLVDLACVRDDADLDELCFGGA